MRKVQSVWRLRFRLISGIILLLGAMAYGENVQKQAPEPSAFSGKVFLFTAKEWGVPILNASIEISNRLSENGKPLYQIQAHIKSLHSPQFLFWMNNYFTSTMELETCSPIRYVKEINQGGFLIKNRNYLQTLTFDYPNQRIVVKKENERQEISIPAETYDPLSMFGRCYLKEELHPKQDIQMFIYDGGRLHQMVFHSTKDRVRSKMFGELDTICLESTTSFSTFGDKEGIIRIWFSADGKKTPISMELDLPVGNVKFELEGIEESQRRTGLTHEEGGNHGLKEGSPSKRSKEGISTTSGLRFSPE